MNSSGGSERVHESTARGAGARVAASFVAIVCLLGAAGFGCAASGERGPAPAEIAAPPAQAPAIPAAGFEPAAAGTPQDGQAVEDAVRDLSVEAQERRAASIAAVAVAERLMSELRYPEAEERLQEALRLDPQNTKARELLETVLLIRGERSGEIREVLRGEVDRQNVRLQQDLVELERLYVSGRQSMEAEEYSAAIRSFEQVLERIRWFPFNVDLSDLRSRAEGSKEESIRLQREMDSRMRREREQRVRENAEAESTRSLEYIENRITEMERKLRGLYADREYEAAAELAEQILELDPSRQDVRQLRRQALELRHLKTVTDISDRTREEWDRTFLSQLESEIPYTNIFNFPSSEEWNRITRKSVSIDARVLETETQQTKDIRAKLRQRYSVEFPDQPLDEVISFLQQISGINFVLNKEARDAVADSGTTVKLPPVNDLALENILSLVLEGLDPPFGYLIQSGAVVIGPTESITADVYLEFYEVSDLTKDHPDFPAPRLALDSGSEEAGGGGGLLNLETDSAGDTTTIEKDVLEELVINSIFGEDGPPDGESIALQGGKLVARTSLENHQKIQRLLDSLRKSTGVMVTVESRFIDLQDNFLYSIGVDYGSPFNSNLPNPISDIDGVGTQISSGFEFVDAQQQTDVRAAVYNAFSLPLGSSVAPFELSDRGGFALQYNVLDTYILEAIIEANEKTQEFKKLDAPRVTAFNTQTSHSLVIDQSAYIKDAEVNQTGVVPVINPVIGILNSGSILQVRPTVSHDRRYVILEIEPTLAVQLPSRFKTLTLGLTTLNVEFPVLSVTNIKTTVTIPDGGTVLVGGLKRTISQDAKVGIPAISRLPMMDFLLGRKGSAQMQSNLFVLISAKITVIRDEETKQFN